MGKFQHLLGRAVREIGQAMDRQGMRFANHEIFQETFTRHRPIMPIWAKYSKIADGVFVAPSAAIVGEVKIAGKSSIWYGATLRADTGSITLGECSNIQDQAIVVTNGKGFSEYGYDVKIGDFVTVGHGAMLTSCSVGDHVLIGQGAIIQEGAVIAQNSMIAAGSNLLPGTEVPTGQLWGGNPGAFKRNLTADELKGLEKSATKYFDLAEEHGKSVQSASILFK